jgi:hypothetical protein
MYDDLTLDEAAAVDLEQTYEVIKNAKRYHFGDARRAISFIGACVKSVMEHLNIKEDMVLHESVLKRIERERNIHIERRTHYGSGDLWRNGIYIYKDDQLLAFIGEPLREVPHPLLPFKRDFGFVVVTNVDPERRQRVYGP